MIEIKKISLYELPPLIKISYENDLELFEKYHIRPNMKLAECVSETFGMIKESSKLCDLTYYKILSKKQPIGFFITTYKRLYSFGIGMKFRRKAILSAWWVMVKTVLGDEFICSLYENNTRAISFLEKQGMEIAEKRALDNSITLLNQAKCHSQQSALGLDLFLASANYSVPGARTVS